MKKRILALVCVICLLIPVFAFASCDHVWHKKASGKYLAYKADCNYPAIYCYSCKLCGKADWSNLFTYGRKLGHDWSDYTCNGMGKHSKVCHRCGSVQNVKCDMAAYPDGSVCLGCGVTDQGDSFARLDAQSNYPHTYSRDPEVRVYGKALSGDDVLYAITVECAHYGERIKARDPMRVTVASPVEGEYTLASYNGVSYTPVDCTVDGGMLNFTANDAGVYVLLAAN